MLQQARDSHTLVQRYEEATGRSKRQLLHDAAATEDGHLLKINGSGENLLDIARRIKAAQKTIKAVERRAKVATGEFARALETIAVGQANSRARQAGIDERQPAAGGEPCQASHEPRARTPRSYPGRQYWPDAGGRQVRIPARLQVRNLRDLVDSAVAVACDCGPEPDNSHSGPYGGDG